MRCPVCGSTIPDEAKLCPICKTLLSDEDQTFGCPMCGTLVEPSAKVCPGCGAEFEDNGEEQKSEPAPEKQAPPAEEPELHVDIETVHDEAMEKIDELVAEEIKDLVKLPGVGLLKARALYEAGFTDLPKLKSASVKELMRVRGIGRKSAAALKRFLQSSDIDGLMKTELKDEDVEAEQSCPICGTILSIFETSCFECGKEMHGRGAGSEERALSHYERMLEVDAQNSDMWYARGAILSKLDRNDEAIQSFEMATELDPKYDQAWIAMANIFTKMGDGKRSAECFQKVIKSAGVGELIPKVGTGDSIEILPKVSVDDVKAFEKELFADGDTPKCPVCATPLEQGAAMCPTCGKDLLLKAELLPPEAAPEPAAEEVAIPTAEAQPSEAVQPATEAQQIPIEQPAVQDQTSSQASEAAQPATAQVSEPPRVAFSVEEIEKTPEKDLYRILSMVASELKPMLSIAKELGLDVTQGKRLISEAVAYGKKKEVRKAVTYILQGQKEVVDSLKVRLLKDISSLENSAEELRLTGANVAHASKLLKEAKGELRKGTFTEVLPRLKEARANIETFQKAMGPG